MSDVAESAEPAAAERAAAPLGAGEYFGTVSRKHASCTCCASAITHHLARELPEHSHRTAYFCMLSGGSYEEEIAGETVTYRPFDVGFHPAMHPHADRIGAGGGDFVSLELTADIPDFGERTPALLPTFMGGSWTQLMTRLAYALKSGAASDLILDSIASELIGGLWRAAGPLERRTPPWLSRCVDIVRAEFGHPLTLAGIAQQLHVHPVHLSREFRRRFGRTLGEYANQIRIREACRSMSADPTLSLAHIAASCGFADQSHFTRTFRATLGCAPSAYRRSAPLPLAAARPDFV